MFTGLDRNIRGYGQWVVGYIGDLVTCNNCDNAGVLSSITHIFIITSQVITQSSLLLKSLAYQSSLVKSPKYLLINHFSVVTHKLALM